MSSTTIGDWQRLSAFSVRPTHGPHQRLRCSVLPVPWARCRTLRGVGGTSHFRAAFDAQRPQLDLQLCLFLSKREKEHLPLAFVRFLDKQHTERVNL
jgi:hypothetical protein